MTRQQIQIIILYLVSLLQGASLVTFPAAGTLITSPAGQNLTTAQYGFLFIFMNIGAIFSSFFAGNLSYRLGLRFLLLLGLLCNVISLVLFASTSLPFISTSLIFPLMNVSLLFVGIGFGTCLTTLNTYIATLFPAQIPTALTALHSLLGIGTAIAPLFVSLAIGKGHWWIEPIILASIFLLIFIASQLILDNKTDAAKKKKIDTHQLGAVFKLFCVMIFLYGICETTFGNWATIFLTSEKKLSLTQASLGLSLFWGMVTLGRIGIAISSFWIKPKWIYAVLPAGIALVFLMIAHAQGSFLNLMLYAAAGLACSGMFPLSISLNQKETPALAGIISGRLVTAYMIGYCVAAYGAGEVNKLFHIPFESIFFYAASIALTMVIIMPFLIRKIKKS